ncbi:MAG: TIGR04086 family membrane protein [Desulfitobacteriia bacterium]|jgi:putative membrane protein (TIGR04086 family)
MSKSLEVTMILKGILIAAVVSLILTIFLSLIYYFTAVQESTNLSLLAAGLSVLSASFYISYRTGSKGLIYGLTIGAGFFILSLIVFFIFYPGNPTWIVMLKKLFISLLAGLIGGTAGALLKK